jgi:hypothetical protein
MDVEVVDIFIEQLESDVGGNTPHNKSCGKVHDYLGIIFDLNKAGEITISMSFYIAMILH